jgi:hypothetical protein
MHIIILTILSLLSLVYSFTVKLLHMKIYCCKGSHTVYRVSQEERSVFLEVKIWIIINKKCICVLFRAVSEIELFHCTVPKLLIGKRYYVLFLIPVFIVQVTKLVQFT